MQQPIIFYARLVSVRPRPPGLRGSEAPHKRGADKKSLCIRIGAQLRSPLAPFRPKLFEHLGISTALALNKVASVRVVAFLVPRLDRGASQSIIDQVVSGNARDPCVGRPFARGQQMIEGHDPETCSAIIGGKAFEKFEIGLKLGGENSADGCADLFLGPSQIGLHRPEFTFSVRQRAGLVYDIRIPAGKFRASSCFGGSIVNCLQGARFRVLTTVSHPFPAGLGRLVRGVRCRPRRVVAVANDGGQACSGFAGLGNRPLRSASRGDRSFEPLTTRAIGGSDNT
jgi:hypothetical protein